MMSLQEAVVRQAIARAHALLMARGLLLCRVPPVQDPTMPVGLPYSARIESLRLRLPLLLDRPWYTAIPLARPDRYTPPLGEQETAAVLGRDLTSLMAALYLVACRRRPSRGHGSSSRGSSSRGAMAGAAR